MKIRLGYVSISKTLDGITPSTNFTYTDYVNKKADKNKINEVIISNLEALDNIIDYNISNNIHFYRLTSKLIPLATHDLVKFDYLKKYKNCYNQISKKIVSSNMRVDVHPDQFTVLNSTKKEVVDNTVKILNYHYNILNSLNIKNKLIILHIGSSVFGKENSLKRFENNFNKLDNKLKKCIGLENDDKVYNIEDTLYLCEKLNIPFILDYHHYNCNGDNNLEKYIERIFNTWSGTCKMHFSTSKNKTKKEFRSHHDYIDLDSFIYFIEFMKKYNKDIDIMLEAKAKDDALFRLVRGLKYKTEYKFIDETTFIV